MSGGGAPLSRPASRATLPQRGEGSAAPLYARRRTSMFSPSTPAEKAIAV